MRRYIDANSTKMQNFQIFGRRNTLKKIKYFKKDKVEEDKEQSHD